MATEATTGRSVVDDSVLAMLAIGGDGDAFSELYERHERRVYGFCLRMLGTPHDAADATQETFVRVLQRLPSLGGSELNFVAYVLTAARHACYDAIDARKKVEPVAEHEELSHPDPGAIDEDPERAALLAATREQVQAANASLPARHREVLALRELESLSYDQIGEIVDLNANAVAQLISRARIKLRDNVHSSALASISSASPECERALPLLAALQDDQQGKLEDLAWLHSHLAACETCRARRAAMQEAGVSYRVLLPIVPLVWLRHAAIARAAELVGADWSEIADRTPGPTDNVHPSGDSPKPAVPANRSRKRRRRWGAVGLLVLLCLLVVTLLADTVGSDRLAPSAPQNASSLAIVAHARARQPSRRFRRGAGRDVDAANKLRTIPAPSRATSVFARGRLSAGGARHKSAHRPADGGVKGAPGHTPGTPVPGTPASSNSSGTPPGNTAPPSSTTTTLPATNAPPGGTATSGSTAPPTGGSTTTPAGGGTTTTGGDTTTGGKGCALAALMCG